MALKETTTVSKQQQQSIIGLAQMRNAMIQLRSEILIEGQDYGVIPGVSKPSLLKPGAEKLISFFQMSVEVDCSDKQLDINNKFISYTYKATVKNSRGKLMTQCEGSVNSYETKYRYSWAAADKPIDQNIEKKMIADKVGKFQKGPTGWQWVERVENPDVIGLQNTIQKMAQKRAIVGAVLLATGASEFFTQDVEDMNFIDVESTVIESNAPTIVPEATTEEKVALMQKTKIEKPGKIEQKSSTVPQDTLDAINAAESLPALQKIYNECEALISNSEFITALSVRKAKIKANQS